MKPRPTDMVPLPLPLAVISRSSSEENWRKGGGGFEGRGSSKTWLQCRRVGGEERSFYFAFLIEHLWRLLCHRAPATANSGCVHSVHFAMSPKFSVCEAPKDPSTWHLCIYSCFLQGAEQTFTHSHPIPSPLIAVLGKLLPHGLRTSCLLCLDSHKAHSCVSLRSLLKCHLLGETFPTHPT